MKAGLPKESSLRPAMLALFCTLLTFIPAEATGGNTMEQQSPWKIRNYRVERKGVERDWLVVAEKWKQQTECWSGGFM